VTTVKEVIKTVRKKCDRCGEYYKPVAYWDESYRIREYAHHIDGISSRCVERSWEICPDCLSKLVAFMDNNEKK